MLFLSGILLLYTAVVVPVQIFVWDYSDPCNKFPTLNVDVCADAFFLVRRPVNGSGRRCRCLPVQRMLHRLRDSFHSAGRVEGR